MPGFFSTLKFKLGLGAGLIGLVAVVASTLMIYGTTQMSLRIETALEAERRIQRYSALATQVSAFIVVAFEVSQSGLDAEDRATRLAGQIDNIRQTFSQIRNDLEKAVSDAEYLGLDEQSRRATRSIGISRMEALFNSTAAQFVDAESRPNDAPLEGFISTFSMGFDQLLTTAVGNELKAREQAIAGITELRRRLINSAIGVLVVTALLLLGFYFGLLRPQLYRLDLLKRTSHEVGKQNFAVTLPVTNHDEISQLFAETNQMVAALAGRKAEVDQNWERLNDTIAERTAELQSANAALAKTDEDRRRFFADMSHELRTPLTVILMETELGLNSGGNPAKSFEIIRNRALRLNRRIDDLLRIARSDSGQITLQSEIFDLSTSTREAIEDMRGKAESSGMTLDIVAPAEIGVLGDNNWARQIVTGLIENAIRYAQTGALINLVVQSDGSYGWVHVIDNGPGVDPDEIGSMFERFKKGRGATRTESFGIGLSLAQWVVEQQKGRIEVASPVPEALRLGSKPGTMVTVFFPTPPG